MATGPVAQILFRKSITIAIVLKLICTGTAIAAVNNTNHLRVYTQDVFGNIRESVYESGWANGTINNVIAQGKIGSPLAATSKALNEVCSKALTPTDRAAKHSLDSCLLHLRRQQAP